MAKKKALNCAQCGAHASFYKKGRGHRVLMCEKGHILAINPIPLLAMAASALAPAAIDYVKEKMAGKKTETSVTTTHPSVVSLPRHSYTMEKLSLALR